MRIPSQTIQAYLLYTGDSATILSLSKRGAARTEILQDHLGVHSLKETLAFEMELLKAEDEMDKLGNNFKMLLRTGKHICVLKAGHNADIALDVSIQAGDLNSVASC